MVERIASSVESLVHLLLLLLLPLTATQAHEVTDSSPVIHGAFADDGSLTTVTVQAVLPADPATCKEHLTDYASYPKWMPGFARVTVQEGATGTTATTSVRQKTAGPDLELDIQWVWDAEAGTLTGTSVKGALLDSVWTWKLEVTDGGTRVTHAITLAHPEDHWLVRQFEDPRHSQAEGIAYTSAVHGLQALERRVTSE